MRAPFDPGFHAARMLSGRTGVGGRLLASGRDREVRGVAAEALQVKASVDGTGLVELDHRLAEGEDVHGGHGYLSSVSRMNSTVA